MRMTPADRSAQILDAALDVAEAGNYRFMTREEIAVKAECSPPLVSAYFGNMEQVRDAVMHAAVEKRRPAIILQGLIARDIIAQQAPEWLRDKARETLS